MTYGGARAISDMAQIIGEYFPDITVKYEDRDSLMPERGTLSVAKARNMLGYDPNWPLEKGFLKYIEWYRSLFARNEVGVG